MSIFLHTSNGNINIPGGSGGGMQQRLDALESQVAALQESNTQLLAALQGKIGADRITRAVDVTTEGWAVDARELNAGIENSLAKKISQISAISNNSVTRKGSWWCNGASTININVEGICFLCCNNVYQMFGLWLVAGKSAVSSTARVKDIVGNDSIEVLPANENGISFRTKTNMGASVLLIGL